MIMLCGIGTGYLLRNKKMSFIGRIITALIWVLLFLLGIEEVLTLVSSAVFRPWDLRR